MTEYSFSNRILEYTPISLRQHMTTQSISNSEVPSRESKRNLNMSVQIPVVSFNPLSLKPYSCTATINFSKHIHVN